MKRPHLRWAGRISMRANHIASVSRNGEIAFDAERILIESSVTMTGRREELGNPPRTDGVSIVRPASGAEITVGRHVANSAIESGSHQDSPSRVL